MKTTKKKTFQKMNLKEFFDNKILNIDELLKVERGKDADMDCTYYGCMSGSLGMLCYVSLCYTNS